MSIVLIVVLFNNMLASKSENEFTLNYSTKVLKLFNNASIQHYCFTIVYGKSIDGDNASHHIHLNSMMPSSAYHLCSLSGCALIESYPCFDF